MNTITINEHTFFPEKLSENPTIVDLGCSKGGFFNNFKKQFEYGIFIGIEANPINYEEIKNLNSDRTFMINSAICSEQRADKEISFVVDIDNGDIGSFVFDETSISLSKTENTLKRFNVSTIKISDIFQKYNLERIDLLKIDIEGAEWELLENLEETLLNKIDQISVEFHDFIDPTKKDRTKGIVERLESFGYKSIISGATLFYGTEYYDCTFYKD